MMKDDEKSLTQVQLMGRGIVGPSVFDTASTSGRSRSASVANYADSAVNIGIRRRLGEQATAGVTAGAIAFDSSPSAIGVHRLYGTARYRSFDVLLGRTRLPTRHIMLPTLRDDDVLALSDLRNPLVDPQAIVPTHYGTVAAVHVAAEGRWNAWGYAEQLTDPSGAAVGSRAAHRFGADFVYEVEDLRAARSIDHVGLGVRASRIFGGWTWDAIASGVAHVRPAPGQLLELRLQAIGSTSARAAVTAAHGRQLAMVGAFRFVTTNRDAPRMQFAVVAGHLRSAFGGGGAHSAIAANALYRIGDGTDVAIQAQEEAFEGSLLTSYPRLRRSVSAVLIVTFDVRLATRIDEPTNLLQMEHAHIP